MAGAAPAATMATVRGVHLLPRSLLIVSPRSISTSGVVFPRRSFLPLSSPKRPHLAVAAKAVDSGSPSSSAPVSAAGAKTVVSDDEFTLAKISFGSIGLGLGSVLLSYPWKSKARGSVIFYYRRKMHHNVNQVNREVTGFLLVVTGSSWMRVGLLYNRSISNQKGYSVKNQSERPRGE